MRTLSGVLTGVVALASIGLLSTPGAQAAVPAAPNTALEVDEALRGTYTPVSPQRILDTRSGLGAPKAPVPAGGVVTLQVAGRGGIPASGVSAVVLNVTVTNTTGSGHLTVYPTGVTRPTASSLNFAKGGLRSNSVTVQLGTGGKADIFTNAGTDVIADVTGWYSTGEAATGLGGRVFPSEPQRLFDSRSEWGEPLWGGEYVVSAVNFGKEDNPHIRALAVNITAVNPVSRGYLTAWDGANEEPPTTSTVNYLAGTVTPNFAIVPVSPCYFCEGDYLNAPLISVYTSVESHVLIDVVGVIDDGTFTDGLQFEPRAPQRIVDSRQGVGVPGKLAGGTTRTVTAPASVLPAETYALALNVTGVAPTTGTYLTVWPTGVDRPVASTLNLAAGQTAANAALVGLGGGNFDQFNVYNNSGSVDLVADMVGAYYLYSGGATGQRAGARGDGFQQREFENMKSHSVRKG